MTRFARVPFTAALAVSVLVTGPIFVCAQTAPAAPRAVTASRSSAVGAKPKRQAKTPAAARPAAKATRPPAVADCDTPATAAAPAPTARPASAAGATPARAAKPSAPAPPADPLAPTVAPCAGETGKS